MEYSRPLICKLQIRLASPARNFIPICLEMHLTILGSGSGSPSRRVLRKVITSQQIRMLETRDVSSSLVSFGIVSEIVRRRRYFMNLISLMFSPRRSQLATHGPVAKSTNVSRHAIIVLFASVQIFINSYASASSTMYAATSSTKLISGKSFNLFCTSIVSRTWPKPTLLRVVKFKPTYYNWLPL